MIKVNEKLDILHDDNGSFSDYTSKAASFGRDSFSFTFTTSEDALYVGFYKPINVFYANLTTANTNTSELTIQYYNGTSFADVAGSYDDTGGFSRSGFIRWDRNQTDEAKTTVNGSEKYWYKLTIDVTTSALTFSGVNIVFSDDEDLKRELYEISDSGFYPGSEATHILSHVAARDEIIQELRADGRYKEDFNTGRLKDITSFDLLDISQVKLASTYLALSKILMAASDAVDDIHMTKSSMYRSLYNKAMQTMYLSIDEDDDGILDRYEELAPNPMMLVRR